MRFLRQSTSVDVPIGPFLDESDARTAETTLTITQPDIRLKKNGGNWAQKNAAQTLSHEENGYYEVTLDATDTNTVGLLRLAVNEAGALPIWEDFMVLSANVYDSLIGGSDTLDVQVTGMGANVITAAAINTDAITAAKLAADVTTELQAGLATAAALTTVSGKIDVIDDFLDTEIAAIKAVTDKLDTAMELDGAVYRFTTNALEQGPSGGSIPTAAQIADEVQTRTIAGVTQVTRLAAQERNDIADAALDRADAVETGLTLRQALRLIAAAVAGKLSGGGTSTVTIRNAVADSKDRIVATTPDANGNRSAITVDLT